MYSDFEPEENKDKNVGVSVHVGFPNAAEDQTGRALDFNALLVRHPSSTFCFRVAGTTYEDRGIFNGDIAVIDRSLTPRPDDLVVYFGDEFTIARYRSLTSKVEVWGVITATVHRTRQ